MYDIISVKHPANLRKYFEDDEENAFSFDIKDVFTE